MAGFVFFNVPTTGHVDPTLPVAAELVRRGHRVDYFLTEAYRSRVEATGATFHAYDGIGPDYFEALIRRFNPVRLATQLVETTVSLLPSLMQALDQIHPQAVVYDSMCPWGRLAAKQASLPAVASMALLDLPVSYVFRSGEWWSAMPAMVGVIPWMPGYLRARRRLQKLTELPVPSFVQVLNWPGDHNLCYTVRAMLPHPDRYGEETSFVGPPVGDGAADVPFPYEQLDPDLPLVYVSLGTVFNRNPGFFRDCLEAFSGRLLQVVVSTGRGVPINDLEPIPENAIVRDYVPQASILAQASLYISHSGVNSVHQALLNGVPMLLVPQQMEQALNATRMKELGAGLILNRRAVKPERIWRMAQRLLSEESFRRQASRLGATLREAGGAARAVDVLEAI